MSLRSKIQSLIDASNETTGESSTDLTSAVQSLVDGYGGGVTKYNVAYNLATNLVSSNTASKIAEGNSYSATISSTNVDYQINTITVTMGGVNITSTAVNGNEINIASVTGNVSITATALFYPAIETETSTLTVNSGGTGTLRVRLHAQPTQTQTVALYSDTLTLSSASLSFTTSNWNTYQSVTITAPSVEETTYAYINLTNSDPMMTESTIMVTVKELGYEDLVDTTIPSGAHTVTASDFTSTSDYSSGGVTYIRLNQYNGSYDNIYIPATIDGKVPWITCDVNSASSASFYGNTTIKYVTFADGIISRGGGSTSGYNASRMFEGCTSLIGVSNMPATITSMYNCFYGCNSFKFLDNLDRLTSLENLQQAFQSCTAIEYIQDLSQLTALDNVQSAFKQSGLKKPFGFPELNTTSANATNMYATCTSLEYGIIPKGVNNLNWAFGNDTALRRVDIYADDIPSTGITSTTFYSCSNLEVYCNANTTTYNSLISAYGSSTQVTIKTFGGGSSTPSIVIWGDSISSPNKPWIEWPARLQTKIGTADYLVKNEALAGEWSTSTTARQGGYEMTTNAFTIPADTTPVALTITVNGNEEFAGNQTDVSGHAGIFSCGGSFNPCTISGVKGTISRSDSTYYFTRLEAGTATNVSANTPIVSDKDTVFNATDNVMIFYLNGNAGWHNDADVLLGMCQDAVDHFEDLGGTKYIISGPAANVALKTGNIKAEVLEFETKAATAFGNHWLNLREYEITYGLSQNNLTASALDTERMADGLVPASLVGGGDTTNIIMYDGVNNRDENHPNVYGANTIMLAFYEKGVALGYWS